MIELNPKIKKALNEIDFVIRYESLSKRYNNPDITPNDRLVYIDGEEVMDMIKKLGYSPLFDSKEKFYKINEEKIGDYTFGVHIILAYGMVDLVWVVKEKEELLLGYPWGIYSRLLIDSDYRIKKPVITSYDDIEEILKDSFEMYEDFKKAICE